MYINIRMNKWYEIKINTAFFLKKLSWFFIQTETNALHINRKLYKSAKHVEGSDL